MAPKASFLTSGDQLGERLSHRTNVVFHCSRSDGFLQGIIVIIAMPLCKDMDDGEGVVTVLEEGMDVVCQAEIFPMSPMRIGCCGTFSSDPKSGLFLDMAKISA
jgi:hypothetical protein